MSAITSSIPRLAPILESSVREVIETMFGLTLDGPNELDGPDPAEIFGIIGLAGKEFRGMLRLGGSNDGVRALAAAFLGGEEMLEGDPSMISDGFGELVNMIGGTLKRQIDESGVKIELSLPSVMEGARGIFDARDGHSQVASMTWTVDGQQLSTTLVFSEEVVED